MVGAAVSWPAMEPGMSLAAAGARAMGEQVERLLEREGGVRAGEAGDVHRMRVATRRLRAQARLFDPALGELGAGDLLEEAARRLRELAATLGAVRDRDVAMAALWADAEAVPSDRAAIERLIARHAHERGAAHRRLVAAIDAGALDWLRSPFRGALAELASPSAPPGSHSYPDPLPEGEETQARVRRRDSVARRGPEL